MKKFILFDFDGTLADSQILYDTAASKALININPKYTQDYCDNLLNGRGWSDVFLEIEKYEEKEKVQQAFKHALVEAKKLTTEGIKLTPNAKQLLTALKEAGCKIAICSNSPLEAISHHLKLCNLDEVFKKEDIFTLESVVNAKPSPEIYLKAIKHFNALKEECLVIEDSIAGLTSACNAGVDAIFYKGGRHNINNPKKVQNILASLKKIKNNSVVGEVENLIEVLDFINERTRFSKN